jgi:hypothetical protein
MTAENGFPDGYSPDETDGPDENAAESSSETQIQLHKAGLEDTATWLYDLAFSSITEVAATEDQFSNQTERKSTDGEDCDTSQALILDLPGQQAKQLSRPIQMLFQTPTKPRLALNELLSEWTTLTEDEIEGVENSEKERNDKVDDKEKIKRNNGPEEPDDLPIIHFKDAVGRKFVFPYTLAKTWAVSERKHSYGFWKSANIFLFKGMEEMINQCFLHVEVIGPHVAAGHYDLLSSTGSIIIPQIWEIMIRPDEKISMHMWPMPEPAEKPSPPGVWYPPRHKISSPNQIPVPAPPYPPAVGKPVESPPFTKPGLKSPDELFSSAAELNAKANLRQKNQKVRSNQTKR